MNKYLSIIGLEIHVELKTKSKMFCQCEANYFGKEPNTNTCPVCLGLPGTLPVPNKKAIEWCILIGKALNCETPSISKFDRKHYFYPDLPKGYQISQYDEPLCIRGYLEIEKKKFRIRRVHLEEDTGKLIHSGGDTLIDFNRSGVPLVEIVTEPDFHDSEDVKRFLEELHTIVRYLGVSDADMEKGSMRLEPNISVQEIPNSKSQFPNKSQISNNKLPNYKVEIKNINSFRFVKQAIDYEIKRQIELIEKGEAPKQETRGFDEKKIATYSQRSKEEAQDYRYFPEPDIPPIVLDTLRVTEIPELPQEKLERYVKEFNLRSSDAFILTRDKELADFFEKVISNFPALPAGRQFPISKQSVANLIINKKISTHLSPSEFIKEAIKLVKPKETDTKVLDVLINQLIKTNRKVVADYKAGKTNAIMFLVGMIMRKMKGKADAKLVIEKLKEKLK